MRDTNGEKQWEWESSEKMTLTPSGESRPLKTLKSKSASGEGEDPWLGVRIRAAAPPDPELLSKIGCCCIVIDLPGVLMDDLSISYRKGLVRMEGERTIGRVKSFRKKVSLNHDQIVTRFLTAFLWQGVLLIVAPTKLAASMAAAAMVAAQIASNGFSFPISNPTPRKPVLLLKMPEPDPKDGHHNKIPIPMMEEEDEVEVEHEPVKFSNNVQVTATTATAAPQPQSAFGPYLPAPKPSDRTLPILPSPSAIDNLHHQQPNRQQPIPSMRPRNLFFPFLPAAKSHEPPQETPCATLYHNQQQQQPQQQQPKPRKFFFTTGLPRNKLQKYPSDDTRRFPSDEPVTSKSKMTIPAISTTREKQVIVTEPQEIIISSAKDGQQQLDLAPEEEKKSESEEEGEDSQSEEEGEDSQQLHGTWSDDSLYDEPSDKPRRRRSVDEYDVIMNDRTMLPPIKEHQVHSFHHRDSLAWSDPCSLMLNDDHPLTYVRFETVWQDNEENVILRDHNRIDMELTIDDEDVDRRRLHGMHGNPNGPLEQRGILLPFEDELYDRDDHGLRMELEPHPCWRSAPFLPGRLDTIDYDARAYDREDGVHLREQPKPPSPSLLRRSRLSARKTVTWVDEI